MDSFRKMLRFQWLNFVILPFPKRISVPARYTAVKCLMKLTTFEHDIVKAIGRHYPVILEVLESLEVKSRENTGSGIYIDFEPIGQPLKSHTQILDLHGTIIVPRAELGAHIEMDDGVPQFLEICCFNFGGWNGDTTGYTIEN